jgi:hypothetical protein
MKTRLLFFLSVVLFFFACQNDTTEGGGEQQNGQNQVINEEAPPSEAPGSFPVVGGQVSDQTKRFITALSRGYWVTEVYVKGKDRQANIDNKGVWYKFDPEGTYVTGRWVEQTGTGSWTYDPQAAKVHLEAEDKSKNAEYSIKISSDETIMIWIGTERYQQNNLQRKMAIYYDLPQSMKDLPQGG